MNELNSEELMNINGGIKWAIVGLVGIIVTFIVGIFDGITRPLSCRAK